MIEPTLSLEEIVNESQGNIDNQLREAILDSNLERVKSLSAKGANLSAADQYSNTPLMLAFKGKNTEIAEFLIRKAVNIHNKDQYGNTALMLAFNDRNLEMIEFLLMRSARCNIEALYELHLSSEQRDLLRQLSKLPKLVEYLFNEQFLKAMPSIFTLASIDDDAKIFLSQKLFNTAAKVFNETNKINDLQASLNLINKNIADSAEVISLSTDAIISGLDAIEPLIRTGVNNEDLEALTPLLQNIKSVVRNSKVVTYLLNHPNIVADNLDQTIQGLEDATEIVVDQDVGIIRLIITNIEPITQSLESIKPSLEKTLEEALDTSFLTKGVASLSTSGDTPFISLFNMCILKQPEAIGDGINRLPSDIREKTAELCKLFPANTRFKDLLEAIEKFTPAEDFYSHSTERVNEGNEANSISPASDNIETVDTELAGGSALGIIDHS